MAKKGEANIGGKHKLPWPCSFTQASSGQAAQPAERVEASRRQRRRQRRRDVHVEHVAVGRADPQRLEAVAPPEGHGGRGRALRDEAGLRVVNGAFFKLSCKKAEPTNV